MTDETPQPLPPPDNKTILQSRLEVRDGLPVFALPEALRTDMRQGAGRVLDRFGNPETTPDLILVLERSGPSAYAAVEALARQRGIALPPSANVHIGREIDSKFTTEFAAQQEAADGTDIYEDGSFGILAKYRQQYGDWMKTDPYVQRLLAGMRKQIAGLKDAKDIRRVLVVDDTSSEGNTRDHTVPLLMDLLFSGRPGGPPAQDFEKVFQDGSWHFAVLRETFGTQFPPDIDYVLAELLTGAVENFDAEDGLERIVGEPQIQKVMAAADERFSFMPSGQTKDILPAFGTQTLVGFRDGLTRAIRENT